VPRERIFSVRDELLDKWMKKINVLIVFDMIDTGQIELVRSKGFFLISNWDGIRGFGVISKQEG